jgi:hypothetical protein
MQDDGLTALAGLVGPGSPYSQPNTLLYPKDPVLSRTYSPYPDARALR